MKRIVITFAIALICGKEVKAQNNLSKLSIGLTTSIEENLSSERINFDRHGEYATHYDKTNYRIGVSLAYALKENLSIITAVEYSNKDFKGRFFCETCNTLFPSEFMNIDYRFIEIPITLRYYMLPGKI
ncbi:porin family protein [Aquimarina rhabdastrellae]